MVNYYRDMWRRRSHLLAPLTKLVGANATFKWEDEQQHAFESMKEIMSKETLLSFPDFGKTFHIYTDASDYQLGAVIMQDDKPLAFYSRKLNKAQRNYTTGEQELLSIVETLKEFRNILLGQDLIVHTDHMNILYGNLSNDRITRWRLLIEEYGPTFKHIKGKDNIVADALSRLSMTEAPNSKPSPDERALHCAMAMSHVIRDESALVPEASNATSMAEAFAGTMDDEAFPLSPRLIAKEQSRDKALQKSFERSPDAYATKVIEDTEVITLGGKIVVPLTLQGRIVAWYHEYLCHPGQTRMENTIGSLFVWNKMRNHIRNYVKTCRKCQMCKKTATKYGTLPPKEAEKSEPWNRVNVDMIGPLTVKTPTKTVELRALTMIDPATGWFEIKDVRRPDAASCMTAMDDTWLCRYPRPQFIGFDNGSEYKQVFKEMCKNYDMKMKPSTTYNPQSNGIIERVHQVLNDCLRTFELEEEELDGNDPWSSFLASTSFAIRSTYHTTLEATPAQLVYGRDMLLPVRFNADWTRIRDNRQTAIQRSNVRENRSRIPHDYTVGDRVLLKKPGVLRKLAKPYTGPHTVERVHNNGTVRIRRGHVTETVNIRRIRPYFERTNN